MAYKLPSLPCLLAFEAVARLRSGKAAAQELCITPSAVTHRIRQLEVAMGRQLFNSATGNFTLTPRGAEYLEVVREALGALSGYGMEGHSVVSPKPLRVTAPPTFARQVLVPRLPDFERAYPEIVITLQISVPLIGLKAEDADVEIRFGRDNYLNSNAVLLMDEPVMPVCSPEYLQTHGPFKDPSSLAGVRLLRSPLQPWRPWFKAAGLNWPEPAEGVEFVDAGLLLEAAACGQGVALGRQSHIELWLRAGTLVPLFDLAATSTYAYYLLTSSSVHRRQQRKSFTDWLLAQFAASGQTPFEQSSGPGEQEGGLS